MLDFMHNAKQRIPAVKQPVMPSVLMNDTLQQYKSHNQLPSLTQPRLIMAPHSVWAKAHAHMNMLRHFRHRHFNRQLSEESV